MKSLLVAVFSLFHFAAADTSGKGYFTQKLDHFNASDDRIWQHRYWYNTNYANPDSNVNFLVLAGEMGSYLMMISDPETTAYVYYAKLLNATLYALDQRFYGDSRPLEDTSLDSLQFLSSHQVIEDVAEFIRQKNKEKGGDQRWIVIGGGYAGSLSAWSRFIHPELIDGALASSAPIQAQIDNYDFIQYLDADFAGIGGLCYKQIGEGLQEALDLFQSKDGRKEISTIFQISPSFDSYDVSENDKSLFFAHVISPFIFAAQNNNPTVPQLCTRFTSKGDKYDPLLELRDINPYLHMTVTFNYTANVEKMKRTNYNDDVETRLWTYQRCAEFGFIQSSNGGQTAFGETQSSNLFLDYCNDVFGITPEELQANVDRTNEFYGGRDYFAGTNVMLTHGTIDPRSSLTKNGDSKHWSVVIAEIEGGWHNSDLGTACDLIPPNCVNNNMAQVQALTMKNIRQWIDRIFPVPDRVNITDNVGKRPQLNYPLVDSQSMKITTKRQRRRSRLTMASIISESRIQQTWDHFNPNEDRTFQQRYWRNDKYGTIDGPNLIMIGGNGIANFSEIGVDSMPMMKYAEELGATAFLLEHRYYGESKLGTSDLQYLSSSQMIYDVATFIRTKKVREKRTGPWITIGSSYGGSLSAWSREWFPELIVGSVASSSPLLIKNDFFEYFHLVENVLHDESQLCFDRVSDAFNQLRLSAMDPEGRRNISDTFNVVPPLDLSPLTSLDSNILFFNLYSIVTTIVENNDANGEDVKLMVCAIFEDISSYPSSVDALRAVQVNAAMDEEISTERSFDHLVAKYANLSISMEENNADEGDLSELLWLYQMCNEFGFHPTTDYGRGIFAVPIPINFHIELCDRVFNLTIDDTERGIARTTYQYGGRSRFQTTNVVFTNGEKDPWKALGITEQMNLDDSVVPIVIEGVTHSADMMEITPQDPPVLTEAREKIIANLKRWIEPSESSTTTDHPFDVTSKRTVGTSETTLTPFSQSTSPSLSTTSTVTLTTSATPRIPSILGIIIPFLTMIYFC